jgi:hypothetical protein
MTWALKTVSQLGDMIRSHSISRDEASEGVRAIVNVAQAACREIQWLLKIATDGGPVADSSTFSTRQLIEEIASKCEEFPVIKTNKGSLAEGFEGLPLRPYKLGKPRSWSVPSVDLAVDEFADFVLHYPQSRGRDFSMLNIPDEKRTWLLEATQRHNLADWAKTFTECIITGWEKVEEQYPYLSNAISNIRSQWERELFSAYDGQIKQHSIKTSKFASLLKRRAKERLRAHLKKGRSSES